MGLSGTKRYHGQLLHNVVRCFCMKALDSMIVICGYRRKASLTSGTVTISRRGRDPTLSMLPTNMNDEIRLHLACVVTTRAIPHGCALYGMGLHRVLLEATLLDKGLAAARLLADMCHLSGMLLHMIEHGVLTVLDNATIRTDELSLLIP